MPPKVAMSSLYPLGILLSFVVNRLWTFQQRGSGRHSLARYVVAYGSGYLINLLALAVVVDQLGHPHEIIQGAMIVFLALYLFTLQKRWVFR